MLNEFLGTKLKIVSGYQGNSTMVIAMERGEVDGVTNSWDSWKSLNPAWLAREEDQSPGADRAEGEGAATSRRCRNSPATKTTARSSQLIISGDALGKPMATAPNVPAERVQALRDAFDATIKDPDFIKAAAAARIEINPIYGVAAAGHRARRCWRRRKNLAARAKIDHRRIAPTSGEHNAYKPASRALEDLVVLDLTHARAGPGLRAPARPTGAPM